MDLQNATNRIAAQSELVAKIKNEVGKVIVGQEKLVDRLVLALVTDGVYNVVKAAMDADLALYAVHLPVDANHAYGNNYELARYLGLKNLKPAFVYHGETIGVVGTLPNGKKVGVCSGGAGCHAVDAKALGCDLFITGEADWGETIAAENVGMPFVCAGHYQTETFGVKAVAKAMARQLKVATVFIPRDDQEAK